MVAILELFCDHTDICDKEIWNSEGGETEDF